MWINKNRCILYKKTEDTNCIQIIFHKTIGITTYWRSNKKDIRKYYGKKVKRMAVLKQHGCVICGYNKCMRALTFHHVNPDDKNFSLRVTYMSKNVDIIINEFHKCMLLCANCHMEIEDKECEF
jgi:hypothetical protein